MRCNWLIEVELEECNGLEKITLKSILKPDWFLKMKMNRKWLHGIAKLAMTNSAKAKTDMSSNNQSAFDSVADCGSLNT
jgi:hypothetical protein